MVSKALPTYKREINLPHYHTCITFINTLPVVIKTCLLIIVQEQASHRLTMISSGCHFQLLQSQTGTIYSCILMPFNLNYLRKWYFQHLNKPIIRKALILAMQKEHYLRLITIISHFNTSCKRKISGPKNFLKYLRTKTN